MPERLQGRRVAIVGGSAGAAGTRMRDLLAAEGASVHVAGGGATVSGGEYDAVVALTRDLPRQVVRDFLERDKVVALVGPAIEALSELGLARGRTVVSAGAGASTLQAEGADVVDRPMAVDQKLVTGREEALEAVCDAICGAVAVAVEERRQDSLVEQTFPASDPLPGPTSIGGKGASETGAGEAEAS